MIQDCAHLISQTISTTVLYAPYALSVKLGRTEPTLVYPISHLSVMLQQTVSTLFDVKIEEFKTLSDIKTGQQSPVITLVQSFFLFSIIPALY